MSNRSDFVKPTIIFSLVGIISCPIPAMVLLSAELGLEKLGFNCLAAMKASWHLAIGACFVLPAAFFLYLLRSRKWFTASEIKTRITGLNLLLYIFIPAALEPYWSTAHTLCYVTDGQNGLELLFSAWLALPILLLLSFVFGQAFRKRHLATLARV